MTGFVGLEAAAGTSTVLGPMTALRGIYFRIGQPRESGLMLEECLSRGVVSPLRLVMHLCQVGGHAVCVNNARPIGLATNLIDRDRHAAMQGKNGQSVCG